MVLPYHPEANGIVERRNAEVMKHLRAMVLVSVDKAKWALYLPLVQRILNATPDSSIGTYPSRLLFGDQLQLQGPLLVEVEGRRDIVEVHDPQSYLSQISAAMKILVERSRVFLDVRNAEAVENAKKLQGNQYSLRSVTMY